MDRDNNCLEELRLRIDEIDSGIHDLLMERSALVEEVAKAKGDEGIVIRPGREAQVIRRLLARHDGRFPVAVLARIWREIISACTALQKPLAVAVFEPEHGPGLERLARAHFGSTTGITHFHSESGVIRAIADANATVGLLPLPDEGASKPWWRHLAGQSAHTPRVIARLPFVREPGGQHEGPEALALALVPHEDSGEDHSLLLVETFDPLSRAAIAKVLAGAGLMLAPGGLCQDSPSEDLYLVEVEGFVATDDPRLARLVRGSEAGVSRVSVAGSFALPVPA